MRHTVSRTAVRGALLLVAWAAACGPGGTPSDDRAQEAKPAGAYTDITVQQLAGMLSSEGYAVLVNVHVPHGADIPGTDLAIPYDEIGDRAGEIPGGRDARIVVYCRSGHMSAQAAGTLASLGYTNVYSLIGGLKAWEAAGL